MQVITSTGFGDSGSSAVTDLLSEYKGIKSYGSEWEFTFLHAPDGLGDLESAIVEGHRLKTDYAINRFLKLAEKLNSQESYQNAFKGKFYTLSQDFINQLTEIKWNGMYEERLETFKTSLSKTKLKYLDFAKTYYAIEKSKSFDMYESDSWRPNFVPAAQMYYTCDLDKFYKCVKVYTSKLFELAAEGKEKLYLDQLLPPISINKYLKYISCDIKVFVIDKDPRDLFLVENIFNGSRFIPYEDVNVFIAWYKATRTKAQESQNKKNIYFCKLDDLVFDYKNECNKIEKFLGFKNEDHIYPLQKFNPEKSCINLKLYKKYDNFTTEIKQIENNLKDFLSKTYEINKTSTNSPEKKIIFNKPIVNVIKQCNEIQKRNIQSKKKEIAFFSTLMVKNLIDFKERKSMIKKIKGLIKIVIGIIIFIPEYIYNLILLSSGK